MEAFKYHVFACNQVKAEGLPCCHARGAEQVIDTLRREVARQGLNGEVQITSCGSIGLCERGPNMIVYPEGIWYSGVTVDDIPEIVREHFAHGRPVQRLTQTDQPAVRREVEANIARWQMSVKAKDAAGVLPDKLQEDNRGFQTSRLLLTAVELDIFTALGDGDTAEGVAARIDTDPRATGLLLDALTAYGLLEKREGRYSNGTTAQRYLAAGAPDDSRMSLLHLVGLWRRWHTLTECVRKGTSVTYTEMKDRDPKWTEAFIAAMHKNAQFRARPVVTTLGAERFRRVLDVGGGSGAYSIAFAQANQELHATVLDLEPVTLIAQRHIAEAGLTDRVTTRIADLNRDALGEGYDLVFLSAIYHMNSDDQNRDLTRRAMAALAPGGMIAVQDFILNPDKSGPFTAALFSLNMLVATPEGASYSITEYTDWLRAAGFVDIRHIPLAGPTGLIVGKRPESR